MLWKFILDYVNSYYGNLYASVHTNLVKIDLNNIIYNYNSPKLENEFSCIKLTPLCIRKRKDKTWRTLHKNFASVVINHV